MRELYLSLLDLESNLKLFITAIEIHKSNTKDYNTLFNDLDENNPDNKKI